MSTSATLNPRKRALAIAANRLVYRLSTRWMLAFSVVYGLYVGLPFLAPVLMRLGWRGGADAIYLAYSFVCHQMPQRSFFLFGPRVMYPLEQIQDVWQDTINPMVLRQYVGEPALGWKVAWSDRMVSMYTSVLVFAWLWYPLRKKIKPLPLWGFFLLLLPMGIDGGTHLVGDFYGIGQGFRYTNGWLAALTNNAFSPAFYVGDAVGSFNFWMRLITGILFGLGAVWFGFPYVEEAFQGAATSIREKFQRAGLPL